MFFVVHGVTKNHSMLFDLLLIRQNRRENAPQIDNYFLKKCKIIWNIGILCVPLQRNQLGMIAKT